MTFLSIIRSDTRRVHIKHPAKPSPVCGGGRNGKSVSQWQADIGPANCLRCNQILINYGMKQLK